ncbi:MAG: hypothetical protein LBS86_05870 [Treponema sp.]|jgi:hypothetical protein|nr:hypothetical protein [Treponema sp.]
MNMHAVRKIVDAGTLDGIFTLPSAFANRRIEIVMRPLEDEPTGTVNIERFLCGDVPWTEATAEELAAGYQAMAADKEREQEAREWREGLTVGAADD